MKLLWWVVVGALVSLSLSAATTYKVLVTGFLPFGNYTTNPSQQVAEALDGVCAQTTYEGFPTMIICWESWILPVNETGSTRVQNYLMENDVIPWQAIIHLGLENVAHGLKLETIGANILAEQVNNTQVPIHEGGPDVIPITADLSYISMTNILSGLHNATEAWSRDAGTYYCNETLYRTLFAIRYKVIKSSNRKRGMLPAAFIHLPNAEDTSLPKDVLLVQRVAGALLAPTTLDI